MGLFFLSLELCADVSGVTLSHCSALYHMKPDQGRKKGPQTLCVGSSEVGDGQLSQQGWGGQKELGGGGSAPLSHPPSPPDRQSGPFTGSCWQRPASGGFLSAEITMRSR